MKLEKITYVGWLGQGNIGDEALYLSNRMIFSQYQFVPDEDRQHSGITLFGGGTVFPIYSIYVRPNRYNYAFGVGVQNPTYWGDFDPVIIEQLKRFDFRLLGVRGNTSRKILKGWGIDSKVIGDPCLLLEPSSYKKRGKTMIAINMGTSHGRIWGGDEERILKETIKLCRLLKKDGYSPVLIPFWDIDFPYVKNISEAADIDLFENWTDIQRVLDFLASCHMLIGEKLHSMIFSASTYTPFISIEYRPKCLDFAESVGFEKYNIRTDKMTAGRVMTLFRDLLNNWSEMHGRLIRNVKIYRRRLRESADRIIADIEFLPDDKWSKPSLLPDVKHRFLCKIDQFFYYRIGNIWRRRALQPPFWRTFRPRSALARARARRAKRRAGA